MLRELRSHARTEVELPVVINDANNRVQCQIRFDTRDISLGGAFLRSDLLFEVGEELDIEFHLPKGPPVRVRGRVVRVARNGGADAAGMGIAFVGMDDADRDAIRDWLADG